MTSAEDSGSRVAAARDEIVRVGGSLYSRRYVHATTGNISARVGDEFLITPTDATLGFLHADKLALVGADGEQISGGSVSKALVLHRRIYAASGDAGFVMHTHSTHLVALTLSGVYQQDDILPPITPYYVMKVGHVPLIPYHRPGDPAVADLVEQSIIMAAERGRSIRAVVLERLGPVVWGPTANAAMAVLEELEETARLWLLTEGQPEPLPPSAIQELNDSFGAAW